MPDTFLCMVCGTAPVRGPKLRCTPCRSAFLQQQGADSAVASRLAEQLVDEDAVDRIAEIIDEDAAARGQAAERMVEPELCGQQCTVAGDPCTRPRAHSGSCMPVGVVFPAGAVDLAVDRYPDDRTVLLPHVPHVPMVDLDQIDPGVRTTASERAPFGPWRRRQCGCDIPRGATSWPHDDRCADATTPLPPDPAAPIFARLRAAIDPDTDGALLRDPARLVCTFPVGAPGHLLLRILQAADDTDLPVDVRAVDGTLELWEVLP